MTAYTLNGWTARPIPAGTVVPRTAAERLIAAKIRGRWRIRLTDLEAYIDAHTAGRNRRP